MHWQKYAKVGVLEATTMINMQIFPPKRMQTTIFARTSQIIGDTLW
jgi:hypothetical protein